MIDKDAFNNIHSAIQNEYEHITKQYGKTYASIYEAYAILKEECEECKEDVDSISELLDDIWKEVRHDDVTELDIDQMRETALCLAEEAVQVAAVSLRFLNTIKEK